MPGPAGGGGVGRPGPIGRGNGAQPELRGRVRPLTVTFASGGGMILRFIADAAVTAARRAMSRVKMSRRHFRSMWHDIAQAEIGFDAAKGDFIS